MYELGIKTENAVHFLSKVVTVSSEFEHAAAAAENTVKLKDEKRLKLTSDSKWGGGLQFFQPWPRGGSTFFVLVAREGYIFS